MSGKPHRKTHEKGTLLQCFSLGWDVSGKVLFTARMEAHNNHVGYFPFQLTVNQDGQTLLVVPSTDERMRVEAS